MVKLLFQGIAFAILFIMAMYLNRAWAQTTVIGPGIGGYTATAMGPYGGRNAYAAGYSVANVMQPVFPIARVGAVPVVVVANGYNPNVLVGPLSGIADLMNVTVPFLDQSFFR